MGENRGNEEVRTESGRGQEWERVRKRRLKRGRSPGGGRKERAMGGRETGEEKERREGEWRTL